MRKFTIPFLVLAFIALSSCHHDNSGQASLKLKVNVMFGSQSLVLNQNYQAPDGKYYNFADFKFFLSHIKLVHSDGSTVEVSPMAYFSLDDAATLTTTLTNTQGSYTGIQFNIGLDSIQNAMPISSDSTNPLWANHFMNWGPGLEYTFTFIDGDGDTSANSQYNFPITYHVGTNPFYTSGPILPKTFSLSSGQTVLTLNADVQKIFYNASDTGTINILTSPTTQTTDNPALAHTFISYFSKIFSLQ